MRSYQHHIGDFNNATRHLNRLERSLYRDLIELYYDTEKQLSDDLQWICRRIVANDCSTDVERLLNEFFLKTPEGWYHDRCEHEIEKYHNLTSQKAIAGKASAAKRAEKRQQALNGCSTAVTNQEPRTKNQEPINTKQNTVRAKARDDVLDKLLSAGLTDQQARDFISQRNAQRAPATITTIDRISKQAVKAGISTAEAILMCLERGWRGFNASWVTQSAVDKQGARKNVVGFVETHTDRAWAEGL